MTNLFDTKRLLLLAGLAIVAVGALPLATPAAAQNRALPWKRVGLQAGAYLPTFNSDVTIDSAALGTGTTVDLENDLGVDESLTSFRVDAFWRFLPRHRLDASYYRLERDGSRVVNRTLRIGDQTFTVGATVTSEIDFDIYQGSYSYSLIHNETFDLAASLGAFVGDVAINFSAAGVGTVNEQLIAPLPVAGGRAAYAITDNLFARLQGQVFYLDAGKFQGSLVDVLVGLDYDVTNNLGLGVGYNYVDIRAKYENDNDLGYAFGAFMLYVRAFL